MSVIPALGSSKPAWARICLKKQNKTKELSGNGLWGCADSSLILTHVSTRSLEGTKSDWPMSSEFQRICTFRDVHTRT
jgi:hypothetical protein